MSQLEARIENDRRQQHVQENRIFCCRASEDPYLALQIIDKAATRLTERDHALNDCSWCEPDDQTDKASCQQRDNRLVYRSNLADFQVVGHPERQDQEEKDKKY